MSDLVRALGGDPAQAGAPRYAYLQKLDSRIQDLVAGKGQASAVRGGASLGGVIVTARDRALVDVYVTGDVAAAARRLRSLGMTVAATSTRAPQRMVEGFLPLGQAVSAAELASTSAVVAVIGGGTSTGSVLSQGDGVLRGPQARVLGATGAGVPVGVMSDSINDVTPGLSGSESSGDLPAGVSDLGDAPSGADEGRAMAEIVYDEAPGITSMVFDTGLIGPATKAANITTLVSHGARVITDDTFWLNEPMFQEGTVAQAVDQATAHGALFISAAGNFARQSWQGKFTPGAGGLNDFGGGDTRQSVADVPAGGQVFLGLQWDEPWGAATDEFSVNVYSDNAFVGTLSPSPGELPYTAVQYKNSDASAHELEIEIHRDSGTGTPTLKYIAKGNFGSFSIKEHATNADAVVPDAASSPNALTTAAECWSLLQSDCGPFGPAGLRSPEVFSSYGPVVHTRDPSGHLLGAVQVLHKPEVAGVDGVATSVGGFSPFFGTSAASPSVAGVAALALSVKPSLTAPELRALLTDPRNALSCTVADPTDACGVGLIEADKVVAAAKDPSPPVVSPLPSPARPTGKNGWYVSPVGVSWSVSDSLSPVFSQSGCAPATFSTNAKTVITCTASSAGGPHTVRFTIKLDRSAPEKLSVSGIRAKRYVRAKLPGPRKLRCHASDPTSGVASCRITGYSRKRGTHHLTITAVNAAGLRSRRTVSYTVAKGR